jgi:hypothetical protein
LLRCPRYDMRMTRENTRRERGVRDLVWSTVAHGALAVVVGGVWGVAWWCGERAGLGPAFVASWAWYAPSLPILAAVVMLARQHRDIAAAVLGASIAVPLLVVVQVMMVRIINGPLEEIGTGRAVGLLWSYVGAPEYLLSVACGVTEAVCAGRADRRREAGCCVACGYSLKGLELGVCPECGFDARTKSRA